MRARRADLARPRPYPPTRLVPGPTGPPTVRACPRSTLVSAIEFFFDTLLVLVCLGVIAFSALAVKKLYQGQR